MKRVAYSFFIIFLSMNAWAVETDHCSENLELRVDSIQVFSSSFVDMQIDEIKDSRESVTVDYESNQYFLNKNIKSINLSLELESRENSICSYKESGAINSRYDIRISGTDKKPVLVIDYFANDVFVDGFRTNVSYTMFSDLNQKKPYSLSGETLQIKSVVTYRVQGELQIDYLSIGKGVIN